MALLNRNDQTEIKSLNISSYVRNNHSPNCSVIPVRAKHRLNSTDRRFSYQIESKGKNHATIPHTSHITAVKSNGKYFPYYCSSQKQQ